jgi:hypothetical protein
MRILKPFKDQTMRLQSRAVHAHRGSLWEAFPPLKYLLTHIKRILEEYEIEPTPLNPPELNPAANLPELDDEIDESRKHIKTSIDNCWVKLDEYYKLMDLTPVYAAAVVLHPGRRWRYFEMKWIAPHQVEWLATAKAYVRMFWEENYRYTNLQRSTGSPSSPLPQAPSPNHTEQDELDAYMNPPGYYDKPDETDTHDEYEDYIQIGPEICERPLE